MIELSDVRKVADAIQAPAMTSTGAYVLPWMLRTLMIGRMRQAGILKLKGADKMKACDFIKMFPDMNDWAPKVLADIRAQAAREGRTAEGTTAADLVKRAAYRGPVELFTMDLCFAADGELGASRKSSGGVAERQPRGFGKSERGA